MFPYGAPPRIQNKGARVSPFWCWGLQSQENGVFWENGSLLV